MGKRGEEKDAKVRMRKRMRGWGEGEDARVKKMSLLRRESAERFKVNGEQEQQNASDVEVGLGMRAKTFGLR